MSTTNWRRTVSRLIIWSTGVGLFLSIVLPVIYWHNLPKRNLDVRIVDKTVPYLDYREHKNLVWGLNHRRITPPGDAQYWDLSSHYVGFHPKTDGTPEGAVRQRLESRHLRGIDALFVADSYGVYEADYREEGPRGRHLDYSRLIYGGFDTKEAQLIREFVDDGGHLVGEFNAFATPTDGEARRILEKLFGVEWTGWTGRYFRDLDDFRSVPRWAPRNYKKHYDREWTFDGPGWVFTHTDTRIFVLVEQLDITPRGMTVDLEPDESLVETANPDVPYRFWFDVVSPIDGTDVLASYDLHLTPKGRKKLQKFKGVGSRFPAIVRAGQNPLRIYMAGDFSDQYEDLGPPHFWGWAKLQQLFSAFRPEDRLEYFSWALYQPVLSRIIDTIIALE